MTDENEILSEIVILAASAKEAYRKMRLAKKNYEKKIYEINELIDELFNIINIDLDIDKVISYIEKEDE